MWTIYWNLCQTIYQTIYLTIYLTIKLTIFWTIEQIRDYILQSLHFTILVDFFKLLKLLLVPFTNRKLILIVNKIILSDIKIKYLRFYLYFLFSIFEPHFLLLSFALTFSFFRFPLYSFLSFFYCLPFSTEEYFICVRPQQRSRCSIQRSSITRTDWV